MWRSFCKLKEVALHSGGRAVLGFYCVEIIEQKKSGNIIVNSIGRSDYHILVPFRPVFYNYIPQYVMSCYGGEASYWIEVNINASFVS